MVIKLAKEVSLGLVFYLVLRQGSLRLGLSWLRFTNIHHTRFYLK